jgi:hypothetical protein
VHAGNGKPEATVATACDAVGLGLELEALDALAEACGATDCDVVGLVEACEVAAAEVAEDGVFSWPGSVEGVVTGFPHADSAKRTRIRIAAAWFRTGLSPESTWIVEEDRPRGAEHARRPAVDPDKAKAPVDAPVGAANQSDAGIRFGFGETRVRVPSPS